MEEAFWDGSDGRETACSAGDSGSLGREDSLETGMATHSRILAGRLHCERNLVSSSLWSCRVSQD